MLIWWFLNKQSVEEQLTVKYHHSDVLPVSTWFEQYSSWVKNYNKLPLFPFPFSYFNIYKILFLMQKNSWNNPNSSLFLALLTSIPKQCLNPKNLMRLIVPNAHHLISFPMPTNPPGRARRGWLKESDSPGFIVISPLPTCVI